MEKNELINTNLNYYLKIIDAIIIGGCDKDEINNYYTKKVFQNIPFPKIKKLFSIPFNIDFDKFDVKYFYKI